MWENKSTIRSSTIGGKIHLLRGISGISKSSMMTSRHYVIFYVIWSHFGVHKATYAATKAEKWKKIQRMKTCHDFRRPKHALDIEENVSRWPKRVTI